MTLKKITGTNTRVVNKKRVKKSDDNKYFNKHFNKYFNKKCTTPKGILSYPMLHEPRITLDGKEQYSCDIFVSKEEMLSERGEKFLSIIEECLEFYELEQDECPAFPITDMDEEDDCPAFAKGTYRIRAKNKLSVPTIIDRKKKNMTKDEVKNIKGGDIGKLNVAPFKYNWQGKVGISLGLEIVMFIEEGEPLGGGSLARLSAIEDMEVEDIEEADIEEADIEEDEDDFSF